MIKVGIVGSAGYTGGELIRLLLNHPQAKIIFAHSSSHADQPFYTVHPDLLGATDMLFSAHQLLDDIDVVFLCMGYGKSVEFMEKSTIPSSVKVIDLSHDFRLHREGNDFIYGLPEFQRETICTATHIANPGCFATTIQLALLPLAAKNLLHSEVHVSAITGSTGAGQQPTSNSHFSWRSSNISVYKPFTHQHLGEILQTLQTLQPDFTRDINFIPIRGNFTRGIMAAVYTPFEGSVEEGLEIYSSYYKGHPFTWISAQNPDVKMATNTNNCILYLEKHNDKLMIISVLDNLLKGASGQAVQNMNLMFNHPENEGLMLKGNAF